MGFGLLRDNAWDGWDTTACKFPIHFISIGIYSLSCPIRPIRPTRIEVVDQHLRGASAIPRHAWRR